MYEFTFSDIPMTDDETVLGAMRMFHDLDAFNLFKIEKQVDFYAFCLPALRFVRSTKSKDAFTMRTTNGKPLKVLIPIF